MIQDLAAKVCSYIENEFECAKQNQLMSNLRKNIQAFNFLRECSCCEFHSQCKPVDITDTRCLGLFDKHKRNDTLPELHPRVFTFCYTTCTCDCRETMRAIVRTPTKQFSFPSTHVNMSQAVL